MIVETARGIEYGHVLIAPREVDNSNVIQPLKAVIRLATPEDDEIEQKNKEKESPDGGCDVYYVNKRKDGTLYLKGGYHRFARSYPGISGW